MLHMEDYFSGRRNSRLPCHSVTQGTLGATSGSGYSISSGWWGLRGQLTSRPVLFKLYYQLTSPGGFVKNADSDFRGRGQHPRACISKKFQAMLLLPLLLLEEYSSRRPEMTRSPSQTASGLSDCISLQMQCTDKSRA